MTERKALAREFSTKSRTLVACGEKIVEESPLDGKMRELRLNELRFLHHLKAYFSEAESTEMTMAEAIEKAALKAGVKKEWAEKYLESRRYKQWVDDRMSEVAVRMGVTVEYLMQKHVDNIEGRRKYTLSQLNSLGELGERVWPKTQRIEHQVEAKDSRGMDEMMKVREEVEALEKKLKEAIGTV